MGTRAHEVDSVILELKGQVAELNEQLSQRDRSLENELAKQEQQVCYCISLCAYLQLKEVMQKLF